MKLYETLEKQLKKELNYVTDNGELKKWVVITKAQNLDGELIEIILGNKELKEKFFVNVKGTMVFKQNLFIQFLEQKNYLNDSFTQYKNKVGLTIDGKYMKQCNEVALVWPFKDCTLEGGQSREEDDREEIFFNEILAQDEITQLLEPKTLTNGKIYTKAGEHTFKKFIRNVEINNKRGLPDKTITDNLIIKGNNLLALHSLKNEFTGKVKLIYIDPPYNTGGDSFKYNDSFNHSTWLTFMKNRLVIARNLLHNEGNIFIQIDDFEDSYLKVLMDEIFGSENFRNKITWKRRGGSANPTNRLNNVVDYILWYSKTDKFTYKPIFSLEDDNTQNYIKERFNNELKDGRKYMLAPIERNAKLGLRKNLRYEYKGYVPKYGWMISKEKLVDFDKRDKLHWNAKNKPNRRIFLDEYQGQPVSCLWTDIKVINPMSKERGDFESGQKPEALLQRIIEMSTNEGDLVLDFFVGSGTTCTTAHKLKRQYIGIEQLDYIEPIPVQRLINVVAGDNSGISRKTKWNGGGSFTYLELKKYNQAFIEKIGAAKNTIALLKIWEQMKAKSFLNYNVDIKKQERHLDEFKTLSIKEQKHHLCEILDKNQLYVNLSSLNDKEFGCTEDEKKVTKDFYQLKK